MINNQAFKLKTDAAAHFHQANGYCLYSAARDQRVVLIMDYEIQNTNSLQLLAVVESYAEKIGADKVSIRVPGHIAQTFIDQGYLVEASVPEYYQAGEPMLFMTRYLSARRALASRAESKEGYHLEIQYRTGQPIPATQSDLLAEDISSGQEQEAIDYCLKQGMVGSQEDLEQILAMNPHIVLVRLGEQIRGLGGLLFQGNGRAARIQGIISPDSEEIVAQVLINKLWTMAKTGGATCIYSLTGTNDDKINRILPAVGFSFRGQLGADLIIDGAYSNRYLWSRSC